jgi:hypothetical protein
MRAAQPHHPPAASNLRGSRVVSQLATLRCRCCQRRQLSLLQRQRHTSLPGPLGLVWRLECSGTVAQHGLWHAACTSSPGAVALQGQLLDGSAIIKQC